MFQMNVNTNESCPTLSECFESCLADRRDRRDGTVTTYRHAFRLVGDMKDVPVDKIRFSDITHLYSYLRYEEGYKPSTINLVDSVLSATFNHALRDDYIMKSPVKGAYHEVARGEAWKSKHRPALTKEQQTEFLNYIHENAQFKHWEPLFITLFGTGIRVGELIGLKWEDVDLKNKLIHVNRSINFEGTTPIEGPTKTEASKRTIPMLDEVAHALATQNTYARLTQTKSGDNVPGKKGYIFLNKKGHVYFKQSINDAINTIVKNYNNEHTDSVLPHFSAHTTRHSFCTRLAENDVNIKVIQSVMGHSDYQTTMDIYTDICDAKKQEDFAELDKKMNGIFKNSKDVA